MIIATILVNVGVFKTEVKNTVVLLIGMGLRIHLYESINSSYVEGASL